MPLTFNFEQVQNFKQKIRSKKNRSIANILVYATMAIGIRKITEKNYKKFYARLTAAEHLNGSYLYAGNKPYYITLEDVERFIGLVTNANEMTAAQFERFLTR